MTVGVDAELRIREYPGDDTATPRAYDFKIINADDLLVTRVNADGSETPLTRGTHYSVSGAGNPTGGDITPLAPIAGNTSWRIEGNIPLGQPTDYTGGDDFPAESHELALDRSMIAHQESRRDILDTQRRAFMVPRGEDAQTLPSAADRANQFLSFDPQGNPLVSPGTGADAGLRQQLGVEGGADLVVLEDGRSMQTTYDRLPSDDSTKYWIGIEYLSTPRALLTSGTGANFTMTGDSTTAGTGLDGDYRPDLHLRSLGRDYGADYLVINNRGQAGKDTADWLTDYLAGDIALPTNLYIVRWGVNDPDTALKALTVAQSLANLEAGLQGLRGAYPLSAASILIMAPNACVGRGRTIAWFREMVEGLRKLARQYQCAFFDTFNFTRDALENIGIGWDDVLGDGTMAIHPEECISGEIYEEVARVLFAGLGPSRSNHFWNRRGATGQELSAAALPSTFVQGGVIDRAYLALGFPTDGFVVTFKNNFSNTNALQIFWNNDGPQFRVGGASWLDWLPAGSLVGAIALGANWGVFGGVVNYTARKSGNTVMLTGILAPGVGAVTACLTLPVGFRPVGRSIHLAAITNSGMLHFSIAVTGVMTLDSVPTTWLSLEGISFQINQ